SGQIDAGPAAITLCAPAGCLLSIVLAAGGIAGFLSRRPVWLRAQRAVMGGMLGMLAVLLAFDTSGSVSHVAGCAGAESCQSGTETARHLNGSIAATVLVGRGIKNSPPRR
ncbi:hypothetical protein ACFHYQ_12185, partial [Sphaerimonospora cavernae]